MTTYLKIDVEASDGAPAAHAGRSDAENMRSVLRFLKSFPAQRTGSVRLSVPGGTKASGTLTAASVQANDTAAINGVTFTAAQKHATGTFTVDASVVATNTVALSGVTLTAVANAATAANNEFRIGAGDGSHASFTAGELASAINTSTTTDIAEVGVKVANAALNGVTLVLNGFTLTFADTLNPAAPATQILVGADEEASAANAAQAINDYCHPTVTCASVVADNTLTVDGVTFTAKAAPDTDGFQFGLGDTDAAQATIIARAVAARRADLRVDQYGAILKFRRRSGRAPLVVTSSGATLTVAGVGPNLVASALGAYILLDVANDQEASFTSDNLAKLTACGFTATASGAVCTVRARLAGAGGNAALAETDGKIDRSAATMTNGAALADAAFCFTGSNTQVAKDLERCIQFSSSALVQQHATASAASAVVTATAKLAGHPGNAVTLAGTVGRLAASVARLAGGTESNAITLSY